MSGLPRSRCTSPRMRVGCPEAALPPLPACSEMCQAACLLAMHAWPGPLLLPCCAVFSCRQHCDLILPLLLLLLLLLLLPPCVPLLLLLLLLLPAAGQLLDGLDLAVQKMKQGERALVTVAPRYAFGDQVGGWVGCLKGALLLRRTSLTASAALAGYR